MGVFGMNFKDMLEEYADTCGGKLHKAGIMHPEHMTFEHNNHTIKVESYTYIAGNVPRTHFRVSALYYEIKTLELRITLGGFLASVTKMFGAQDIQIDHPDFDDKYIIKGNDEMLIKHLLDDNLRASIIDADRLILYVSSGGTFSGINVPQGMKAMIMDYDGIPKDTESMTKYIDVIKCAVDSLISLGVAQSKNDGNII